MSRRCKGFHQWARMWNGAGQLTGYRCCACGLVREREGK